MYRKNRFQCEHFDNSVEYLEHVKFVVYDYTRIIGNSQNCKPSHYIKETKIELWH